MLTKKAARELVNGLNAEDADLNCYCTQDVCDAYHPADDNLGPPRFGIAFVTDAGHLDHAANTEAYGSNHGQCLPDVENVVLELRGYAEWIDSLVVIDRETGQWWDGVNFPS